MEKETVIKALECCKTPTPIDCRACGYKDQTTPEFLGCCNLLVADALALIKDQERRLKQECKNNEAQAEVIKKLRDKIKDVPADTVREFAERLKKKLERIPQYHFTYLECERIIDNIAKEMSSEKVCTDCKYFIGCECFDGEICDLYTEVKRNEED